jgi:hypothetical protein
MRRGAKIACAAALFAGLITGLFIFFPWNAAATFAVNGAMDKAARSGIYITAGDRYIEGATSKTVVLRSVKADFPVFSVSLSELRITPSLLTLLFGGARFDVKTGRGALVPMMGEKLEWMSSEAAVAENGGNLSVSDIKMTGKLSASGFLELSPEKGKITKADLKIKSPPEADMMFRMAAASGLIPISSAKPGEWRIERR